MNIGNNTSNTTNSRQPYHSSGTVPAPSYAPSVVSPPAPTPQLPPLSLSVPSTPTSQHGSTDQTTNNNRVTNLIKPSSFFPLPASSASLIIPPVASSVPNAAALHPPLNLQRPYGAPMLQPFPPPTPPPSLTPNSAPPAPIDGPLINREKVREALLMVVQVYSSFVSFPFFIIILPIIQ